MHETEGTSPNLLQIMLRDERVLLAMSICIVGGEEGEREEEREEGEGEREEEGEGRERRERRRERGREEWGEVTKNCTASCIINHLAKNKQKQKHVTSERAGAEGSPMLLLPRLRVVRVVFLRRAFRIG